MSWICVGCHQVQETKDGFAPVLNHTHTIEEQNVAPVEHAVEAQAAPPASTGLSADELAKLRDELLGLTPKELQQLQLKSLV